MTQIRETIESLCIVLKCNGISEITAETFRLAKFDNPDTTKPMWVTLKNSLVWIDMITKNGRKLDIEGGIGKIPVEIPVVVCYCKHEMFSRGYRMKSFFALPEDMKYGSRDVLLALGWLMAKEKIIKKFASLAKRQINEDLPFKDLYSSGISDVKVDLDYSTAGQFKFTNEKEKLLHMVEGIISLKGKLDAACRSLLAAKNEYALLLNRIHTATVPFPQKSSSPNHLSAIDVYHLYNQKELIKYQEKLESENLYLKSLILLMDKETSFWKWMESALDAKLKSNTESSEENENQGSLTLSNEDYKPCKEVQGIKTKQVEFSRLLQKQENLYTEVSTKWKRYKNAVEESEEMQEEFQALLYCLDQEVLDELEGIKIDTNNRTLDQIPRRPSSLIKMQLSDLQGPLKLITPCFRQEKKHRKANLPTHEQSVIAKVTQELSEQDALLKEELFNLKKEHNDRITQFSLTMKDVVCIPPHNFR